MWSVNLIIGPDYNDYNPVLLRCVLVKTFYATVDNSLGKRGMRVPSRDRMVRFSLLRLNNNATSFVKTSNNGSYRCVIICADHGSSTFVVLVRAR